MTILCGRVLGAKTGSLVASLYTECTTTADITIIISSTVHCTLSFLNVLNLQFVSDENNNTILVVGTFATSDIPAILGLEKFAGLRVSWRHMQ